MSDLARAQQTLRLLNPPWRTKYEMLEDVRTLQIIDRPSKGASNCCAQNIEDDLTKKIVAALEKEKNEKLLKEARYKKLIEMSDELRNVNRYLVSAETTKELVAQLKKEDAEIDRRTELAIKQAKQIRAEILQMEECNKQKEIELALKKKKYGEELRLQMAEKDWKRMQKEKVRLREDIEMKEMVKLLKEEQQKSLQSNELRKRKERSEILEIIRQRAEVRKQKEIDETNLGLLQFEMQNKRDELDRYCKDAREKRIQDRLKIGETIGEQILAANNAKTQRINDIIEFFYLANEEDINNRCEEEKHKANEIRKLIQHSEKVQLEEKKARKDKTLMKTNELRQKRLTQTHHNEIDLQRKRMERERLEVEQYLKGKAMDRADLEAKQTLGCASDIQESKDREDIEALRIKILQEQPISLLRYLPSSLLRTGYLPQTMLDRVREQVRKDPIPVLNNIRYKNQGEEPIICCKSSCPPPKRISNIF